MKRRNKRTGMGVLILKNRSMKVNFKNVLGKAEGTLAQIFTANAATPNKAASACFTKKL